MLSRGTSALLWLICGGAGMYCFFGPPGFASRAGDDMLIWVTLFGSTMFVLVFLFCDLNRPYHCSLPGLRPVRNPSLAELYATASPTWLLRFTIYRVVSVLMVVLLWMTAQPLDVWSQSIMTSIKAEGSGFPLMLGTWLLPFAAIFIAGTLFWRPLRVKWQIAREIEAAAAPQVQTWDEQLQQVEEEMENHRGRW